MRMEEREIIVIDIFGVMDIVIVKEMMSKMSKVKYLVGFRNV